MSARIQPCWFPQVPWSVRDQGPAVLICVVALWAAATCAGQTPASAPVSTPAQSLNTPAVGTSASSEPSSPPIPSGATELDRVVAIVNGDLILDSDVDQERRFAAFNPYYNTSGSFSRETAIEQLINRDLILQQLKLEPQTGISDAAVNKEINGLKTTIPACKQYDCGTQQGWDRVLADLGFTEQTLFARWKQRMQVLQFIEQRFRMGAHITPEEIKTYYDRTLLPEYARRHAAPPSLEAISDEIEEVLVQQQVTNLLNDWLKSLRAQGSVVVLHPGEAAP